MRISFLIFATILSVQAQATWKKIIECNNGEFVVDQGNNDSMGRPTYQLVLRGQPLRYFVQQGAIDPKDTNTSGEFITWLNTYDSQLMAFTSYGMAANGMQIFRSYWISRNFGDVSIRATIGNRYLGENEKANWQFHDCR